MSAACFGVRTREFLAFRSPRSLKAWHHLFAALEGFAIRCRHLRTRDDGKRVKMFQDQLEISPEALLEVAPRLVSFRIDRLELPKSDPTWRFALAANPSSPGFLLQFFGEDGTVGSSSVGEIQHLGYRLGDMRASLEVALPRLVAGGGWSAAEGLTGPSRALVQMALMDLVARSKQVAAHRLLGGLERDSVRVTRIL